ncbi:MAG: ubiquitin carboxyl-terminal hydrolase [Amphiamblys sp. WSBS2006]|nr:MAG: ubiquitin carboxyl-terminal hydrolase [Amphiamblys sp. WSBS2006]
MCWRLMKYSPLRNIGNTCYANAVLNALFHCRRFREALLRERDISPDNTDTSSTVEVPKKVWKRSLLAKLLCRRSAETETATACVMAELTRLFTRMETERGSVSPRRFLEVLWERNRSLVPYTQEDAHEFLGSLLNTLDSVLMQRRLCSWVRGLFSGIVFSEIKCDNCCTVSKTKEPFLDLSLDVLENSSVFSCIAHKFGDEKMTEETSFFCAVCRSPQNATRTTRLGSIPSVLVLHLKRFQYTEAGQTKLKACVVFPHHLRQDGMLYTLSSLVVHCGPSAQTGHYVCAAKTDAGGWILIDDEKTEHIPEEELARFYGGIDTAREEPRHRTETAYLLFFESSHFESSHFEASH